MSNYLDYKNRVSFCKMMINEIGDYPQKIEELFKFIWSPRFIHYHELLLLLFYYNHNRKKNLIVGENGMNELIEKLEKINHLDFDTFKIYNKNEVEFENYLIKKTELPYERNGSIPKVYVAIGSLNISLKKCIDACYSRECNITFEDKKTFFNILRDTYDFLKNKNDTMFLVLPELCFPIYWINDLINFSKATNIGIITGIQYIKGDNNRQINYVATILPFFSGKKKYKNVFLNIREKNDYSPIEFEELAKIGFCCENKKIAEYQIFNWNGIKLSPIVCYELTDIMARALLKGKTEFIAVPVFNPDTTYFSNIIDSSVRDLHAFIIQSNTSFYGDSRITGPYDRDNKDIFKIKGGDNDHVVIGTIDYIKYKIYQYNYESNFEMRLKLIEKIRKKKKPIFPTKKREKPDIKPFSARFKIK